MPKLQILPPPERRVRITSCNSNAHFGSLLANNQLVCGVLERPLCARCHMLVPRLPCCSTTDGCLLLYQDDDLARRIDAFSVVAKSSA